MNDQRLRQSTVVVATPEFVRSAADLDRTISGSLWKTLNKLVTAPDSRGLNLERIKGTEDMESCRVNRDVRVVVRRVDQKIHLLFVARHDDAYAWAVRKASPPSALLIAGMYFRVGPHTVDFEGSAYVLSRSRAVPLVEITGDLTRAMSEVEKLKALDEHLERRRKVAEQAERLAAHAKADRLSALLDALSDRDGVQLAQLFGSIAEFHSNPQVIERLAWHLPTLISDLASASVDERLNTMKMLEWLGAQAASAAPFLALVIAGENSPERWQAKVTFQSLTGRWPD